MSEAPARNHQPAVTPYRLTRLKLGAAAAVSGHVARCSSLSVTVISWIEASVADERKHGFTGAASAYGGYVERIQSPRLYSDLAGWFHLLTAPSEYSDEAALYRQLLESMGPIRTVLELGSGGGNNASHLKVHFQMTLVDVSPQMLQESQRINPECEHLVGDMRSLRLGRRFDAVFIHDAVDYLINIDDLRAAMATAHIHLQPGGVVLLCPSHLRESFAPGTEHGGHDEGARGLRYLEWTWDPIPSDTTYVVDFAYLLRDRMHVRVEHDRHILGLFTRNEWLTGLRDTGFRQVESHLGPERTEVLIAIR